MGENNKDIIQERKSTFNKLLIFTLGVFGLLLATAYVIWLIEPSIVNMPAMKVAWLNGPVAYYIVCFISYLINVTFLYSIVFKARALIGFLLALPTMILWPFLAKYNMVMSTLVPFLYTLIIYISNLIYRYKKGLIKREKLTFKQLCIHLLQNPIIRFILLALGISAYQYISGIIKLNAFKIGMNILTTIDMIMYSLDLYLVYALSYIFSRKGGICDGLENLLWKFRKTSQISEENLVEAKFSIKDLSPKQKLIFIGLATIIQLVQFLLVLAIGLVNNKIIEIVILLFSLIIARTFILKKTLHANGIISCTLITCLVFWALLKLTPPLGVSIFLGATLAIAFAFALYLIAIALGDKAFIETKLLELEKQYQELLKQIEQEDINSMNEEELTQYCIKKGLNDVEIALVINKIIYKRKNVDILPILGYEKSRFYEIRQEIIKKGVNLPGNNSKNKRAN